MTGSCFSILRPVPFGLHCTHWPAAFCGYEILDKHRKFAYMLMTERPLVNSLVIPPTSILMLSINCLPSHLALCWLYRMRNICCPTYCRFVYERSSFYSFKMNLYAHTNIKLWDTIFFFCRARCVTFQLWDRNWWWWYTNSKWHTGS